MKVKKQKNMLKQCLASIMAVSIMASSAAMLPANGMMTVQAASTVFPGENVIHNAGFEEELDNGNWTTYNFGAGGITKDETHGGSSAVKMTATGSSLEQVVSGLQPGVTYVYSIWAKAESTSSSYRIGVKGYGGSEKNIKVDSTEWKKYEVEFVAGQDSARVYVWAENANGGAVYVDDASLVAKSDIKQATVVNGSLQVAFNEDFSGGISADNFSATYSSSLNPTEVKELELKDSTISGKEIRWSFDEVEAQPVEQTITVNLTYATGMDAAAKQVLTMDFVVEASDEEVVVAKMADFQAENGSLTVTLDQAPTVAPKAEDFAFTYKKDNGAFSELKVSGFAYSAAEKKVTFQFNQLVGNPEAKQTITVKAAYQEETKEAAFELEKTEAKIYYVSATGNDTNDGLSEDAPLQSIEKLNEILFAPGDQILFKKGDTFQGSLKPQGSGVEGHPIVIASYGEESAAKPILKQGTENWTAKLMTADVYQGDVTVNNGITFYNQQYWEVRDLELVGNQTAQTNVYNRGINVTGEDAGDLTHMYFDNLTIHNFYGPNSNIGKSSGGILFETWAPNGADPEDHISTSVDDIRITNCELYNLGRSGVNFVTVWAKRTDDYDTKWGPYPGSHGANRVGYERNPYNDFRLENNYIHNIQGDGCIVDTCDDAIVQNNLVVRCLEYTSTMAVGLFNWNSDDTIFQFNEVYDTQPGGDGQGIEIDALNDRTWVQYNYLHDNLGGSMMWCNTSTLYGFDGIYRYNIFENDERLHGVIDWRPGSYDSQAYNNTIIMKNNQDLELSGTTNFINGGAGTASNNRFVNNIFYYPSTGEGDLFTPNSFAEESIEWDHNIFYNFATLPKNGENFNIDPMFVNPGTENSTDGTEPGVLGDASGYKLQEGSPAINAGLPVADNGGRDYFGNPVTGIPDIGAYESGTESFVVDSPVYTVDQEKKIITILDSLSLTAADVLKNLYYDNGLTVKIMRGDAEITGSNLIAEGDTVTVSHGTDKIVYQIAIEHDDHLLDITSDEYIVDLENDLIRVPELGVTEITVSELLNHLTSGEGAQIQVFRKKEPLKEDDLIQIGDHLVISKNGYEQSYYITGYDNPTVSGRDISADNCSATAGSVEDPGTASEGAADLVLDGNSGTIWHSDWDGDSRENLYIDISVDGDYLIDGLRCLPRSGGGTNGIITKYKLQYSEDGITFKDIPGAEGDWGSSGWQKASFAPVKAKTIRLYAVDSKTQQANQIFASAAEIRLTGVEDTGTLETPDAPKTPEAESDANRVVVTWNAPEDTDNAAGYYVTVKGKDGFERKIYIASVAQTFAVINGLESGTEYEITVTTVGKDGTESAEASTTVSTKQEVNKDKLQDLYDEYKDLEQGNYTDASWKNFETALEEAEKVLNDSNATQNEVNEAFNVLETAKENLKTDSEKPADKDELQDLYNEYKDLEQGNYTDASWKDFETALKEAEKVLDNPDATQNEVNEVFNALETAKGNLKTDSEKPANKDKLQDLYNEYKDLEQENYTDASWKNFETALKEAEKVLNDSDATQDEVNEACKALETAKGNLTTDSSGGITGGGTTAPQTHAGWKLNAVGWWYENTDGSYPTNNWQMIDGQWYYFDAAGYMVTGWNWIDNDWFYLNPQADGHQGEMQTGWVFDGENWFYCNPVSDGTRGAMETGWIFDHNYQAWFYLNPNADGSCGKMLSGWNWIDGKCYYFYENGSMAAAETTPDGFEVDASGAWVQR